MKSIHLFHGKILHFGKEYEHVFIPFSLLALFGFLLFIIINPTLSESPQYDNIYLRGVSSFLGLILLVNSILNKYFRKNISIIYYLWFFTIIFTQPFFFSFMLLKNNFNYLWSLNTLMTLGLMLIIFEWGVAFILSAIGIGFGFVFYFLTTNHISYPPTTSLFLSSFISLMLYGLFFSYRKKLEIYKKIETLKSMSGAIAHEMRTPLANVLIIGQIINKRLEKVKNHLNRVSIEDPPLNKELVLLSEAANNLANISRRSQNLINLLLTNLKQDLETFPQKILSMEDILLYTLQEFAYKPCEEEKVHVNIQSDFQFRGNKELVIHIFFNLLKNSLYFIQACGKGEIFITVTAEVHRNIIIFKDTGPGIEKKQLPLLFKPFYSKRPHGTGIGLSFCKRAIDAMRGTISVTSQLGKHTTFIINFPKIETSSLKTKEGTKQCTI